MIIPTSVPSAWSSEKFSSNSVIFNFVVLFLVIKNNDQSSYNDKWIDFVTMGNHFECLPLISVMIPVFQLIPVLEIWG